MISIQCSGFRIRAVPVLAAFVLSSLICLAQENPASSIPESEITALKKELAEGVKGASSVEVRRACKSVMRKSQALVDAAAGAPNRWELLGVVFDAQKRLISLEFTEENRRAIFEISAKLIEAPDEYAELRLEADMLLMEKDLAEAGAKVADRVAALKVMLAKYRGTAAEWQSLVMGSMIATKLLDFDYEQKIQDSMLERFAGDHNVIQYRRTQQKGSQVDAVFSGKYRTSSGIWMTFPNDLMGHQYVVYFWSQSMPDLDKQLAAVKAVQDGNPGRFRIFSANLDELPDAGEKILRKMNLDWTALQVPGGRGSSAFRAYAERDPNAVFVNGQGHAFLATPPPSLGSTDLQGVHQGVLGGWNVPSLSGRLDSERYLAQLRYLYIGDFLVADGVEPVPPAGEGRAGRPALPELQAIQECFTKPPFRYRLTQKEELEHYGKAEKLCADAIKKNDKAQDLWLVRNRRIIALMGMWRLACESKYLDQAADEANAVLASPLPAGADVVARFCLAKKALRDGGADPEALCAGIVSETAEKKASAYALAAATVLALEANARTAHNQYRDKLLDEKEVDPGLWPVLSFLRDYHHRYRNFWASPGGHGYGREQKYELRNAVSGLGAPLDRGSIEFMLSKPGGGELAVPKMAGGKMLGVIFAEPPEGLAARSNLVSQIGNFGRCFKGQGVEVVVAIVTSDTNSVVSFAAQLDTGFHVGIVEGGIANPLLQKLGILSADEIPNPLLFRPDGSIEWMISGLQYRAFGDRHPSEAISLAIGSNIDKVRSDAAFKALAKGEYKPALDLFDAFKGQGGEDDWWMSDRHQGRALAHFGLKEWDAALAEIDKAIGQRIDDFSSGICKCHGMVEMYLTKAMILEKLDRGREAKIEVRRAEAERLPHGKVPPSKGRQGVPVGVYYDWLKKIRLGMEGGKAAGDQ